MVYDSQEMERIIQTICDELTAKNRTRDLTLTRSRALIRHCANSIRATHRHDYDLARELLARARAASQEMCDDARVFPDVYFAGYLQDAVKELVEAAMTLALVTEEPLPTPEQMGAEGPAYLNGLAEAIGEMRRFALDSVRRGDIAEAERILAIMDDVYGQLVTIDFPDSLTRGLRRTTDMVRGVTEKTRGDLTTAVRQEQLKAALRGLELRLDMDSD